MPLEEFYGLIAGLKKKIYYIAAVFGIGAMVSFSFMGEVIKKIQNDMFWGLLEELSDKPDAARQLIDISHNLTSISNELAASNSIIAQNLSELSGRIMNISQNLNLLKPTLVYLTPLEVIMLEFKMSLIFGALLASPLIIYYGYKGLKGRLPDAIVKRKSFIIFTIIAAILLFLTGAGYTYFYMLPFFLKYLYKDAMNIGINANFSVYEFIYFVIMTTVMFGLAFELPLILNLLVHFGVTTRETLSHYRRHAYIILLVIAAWITPGPDITSQIMLAVPFIFLYEASLLVMRLTGR